MTGYFAAILAVEMPQEDAGGTYVGLAITIPGGGVESGGA